LARNAHGRIFLLMANALMLFLRTITTASPHNLGSRNINSGKYSTMRF
jgi:hypothetical protein